MRGAFWAHHVGLWSDQPGDRECPGCSAASGDLADLKPSTGLCFSASNCAQFRFRVFPTHGLQDKNSEPEAQAAFIKLTEEYEANWGRKR